jgi:L-ascorbate metabolism protein UlaG (beta-lactamase superfamily)
MRSPIRFLIGPAFVVFILSLIFLTGLTACSSGAPVRPVNDHFDGEHFFNPELGPIDKSFWDLMKWQWGGTRAAWPDSVPVTPALVPVAAREVSATFVGHATFVVRFPSTPDSALTVLIDPIWSDRCSPVTWAGPRRAQAPGVRFEALPHVDVVLVSHNHYDHMDMPTLVRLAARDNPLFLVPIGDAELLREAGITRVEELEWWESRNVASVTITFLPAQHWSNRLDKSRNTSLWGSWGLRGADGTSVYHGGDTGYGSHFKKIRGRWGAADLALLPIGAYKPRWFLKDQHMDPAEAVQAARDLDAAASVGMHFGTFRLADEPYGSPETDLAAARGETVFSAPLPGQTFFTTKE